MPPSDESDLEVKLSLSVDTKKSSLYFSETKLREPAHHPSLCEPPADGIRFNLSKKEREIDIRVHQRARNQKSFISNA